MATVIRIPGALRSTTDGQARITVDGSNVAEALDHLESLYPSLKGRLRDEGGAPAPFVNFFVSGEDIRLLNGVHTPVDGAELSIVPSVAGG